MKYKTGHNAKNVGYGERLSNKSSRRISFTAKISVKNVIKNKKSVNNT